MVTEANSATIRAVRDSGLEQRIAAAIGAKWVHPPVEQPAIRSFAERAHNFRIGVTWPTQTHQGGLATFNIAEHERLARDLENAGIDYVLMTDGWANTATGETDSGLRSALWAVPVILATRQLGVVTSMRTNYLAPMHIARFGSHLDWLSGGRWALCVTPGQGQEAARLYGRDEELPLAQRYAKAVEVVDAVLAIWQARDEGVDFEGNFVAVHGKSKRPFTTQLPHPPLFGVGNSAPALTLAASRLDVSILSSLDVEHLTALERGLAAEAAKTGRRPPSLYVKASIASLGETLPEAAGRVTCLAEQGLIDGLLIDLRGYERAAIDELASLVSLLSEQGLLSPLATRAESW